MPWGDTPPKVLPLRELVADGYLQEANRTFFNPMGLALAIDPSNGRIIVLDFRESAEEVLLDTTQATAEKSKRFAILQSQRMAKRKKRVGFWRQPETDTEAIT